MTIALRRAAIGRGPSAAVPPMDARITAGAPVVIAVETAERPALVALMLAGRLKAESGDVLIDGAATGRDRRAARRLRESVALVDTPTVAEPSPGVALELVVAEELEFAGRPSGARRVRSLLAREGLAEHARTPMRAVPPAVRIRLLARLALLRHGVDTLIVTSPERHGGDPRAWFGALRELAEFGIRIAIVTDAATAALLVTMGARSADAPAPEAAPAPETSDIPTPLAEAS
ncbi:MAG: hypothetical protein ABW040_07345 [Microbacteriaceae bacterium]